MFPTGYPVATIEPPPALLQRPPPQAIVVYAQKLVGSIKQVDDKQVILNIRPSWNEFDQLISIYVSHLYEEYSFRIKNLPKEAAMIVVMLSIAASYQTKILFAEEKCFLTTPVEYHILVQHLLCHILHQYILFFQLPKNIEWNDIINNINPTYSDSFKIVKKINIDKLQPKYDAIAIPTLLFQILYYLYYYDRSEKVMTQYSETLLSDHTWIINYYKFFRIFRNYILTNKLNKYEFYLRKYFQSQFDVSYILMTSMQLIILRSIKIDASIKIGIDKKELQMSLFEDILSPRCQFICKAPSRAYSPVLQLDPIRSFSDVIMTEYIWYDMRILTYKQKRNQSIFFKYFDKY